MTSEHWDFYKEAWDSDGFNSFAASLVSLNRIVADNRSDYCKQKVYSKNLPKASIVVIFYNELWQVLIRMLHSIILNTPWELIEEIVLVDDCSDQEHLREPLEEYCEKLKKVKIVRSHKRLGVAAARVLGYVNANGPIIVSIDCDMEVSPGWLEPLLDRLKDNPTMAVYGAIKVTHYDNFGMPYDDKRVLTAFHPK